MRRGGALAILAAAMATALATAPAGAVLDIEDRGPVLDAGNFSMRVTNCGILGNAYFDVGRSFDPSFEYPRGSGIELLDYAALWVGARSASGEPRVSGGPLLEFRPSLDEDDRVVVGLAGQRGSRRGIDDDGDGTIDEEMLNRRDDDGDGETDEDMAIVSDKVLAADYTDDRPEAVSYLYPNGEHHVPLGLSVHHEVFGWGAAGADNIAGVTFTVTNHSPHTLTDVYLGLFADLDVRARSDVAGYLDDRVYESNLHRVTFTGVSNLESGDPDPFRQWTKRCFETMQRFAVVTEDASGLSRRPRMALMPLGHTTDPLHLFVNDAFQGVRQARARARAPVKDTTFRYTVFGADLPPGRGGAPVLDEDRYRALRNEFPGLGVSDIPRDYSVLVSCGPFTPLAPGQSVEMRLAFVAVPDSIELEPALFDAAMLHRGERLNLVRDTVGVGQSATAFHEGYSGINGHEICYEPPPGIVFNYDGHCPDKFIMDPAYRPPPVTFPPVHPVEDTYAHGHCFWTDLDCDACTGLDGTDTEYRWAGPGVAPPSPAFQSVPGDHQVVIAWDNMPEILYEAGVIESQGYEFSGYRVYRLSDWSRETVLPPPRSLELIGAYGRDTTQREIPIESIRDTTMDYDIIRFGRPHFPIGYYRVVDHEVLNGFDYLYVVTSVAEKRIEEGGGTRVLRIESPVSASIDSIAVPQQSPSTEAGRVWVVPNPYRGGAPWDRPPVPGDPFGRHIDFYGMPRARSTLKIWTVAGDLVAQIEHDGIVGDGQASWNLISRNGQDIESGIYLFTVDSTVGHQTGKFVIIR